MPETSRHDLSNGFLESCQICGIGPLERVLDLGHQAPCDSLLTRDQLNRAESLYPLRFCVCGNCGLAQIDYVVPPEVLFYSEYPYRSGITPTLAGNLKGIAPRILENMTVPEGSLVVDLGSNDGTILKGFQACGMRVLGVEPTNIAHLARSGGIPTIQEFFNEDVARRIVDEHGQASIVTAANMFAHVANLGSLIRGVEILLQEGCVFLTESHYLLDLIATAQYDSIYHEHLKYYTLQSLKRLFDYYDFALTDAERIPNYGGSIRAYATKGGGNPSRRLEDLIEEERRVEVASPGAYGSFVDRVRKSKVDLLHVILEAKNRGESLVGIGCPGRSSTLLNYVGLDVDHMPYIAEQSECLKIGMYLPGKHIPIVDEERMFEEQPENAVMLSWHYADPIVRKLRGKGLRSRIIIPLPEVRVIDR